MPIPLEIQAIIDRLEKELEEKRRLAEEEARKKAAAEAGPSLEEISLEDRLTHIVFRRNFSKTNSGNC